MAYWIRGHQEMGAKGPVLTTVTVIKNVSWATLGGTGFGLRGQHSAPPRRARPHCGRVVGTFHLHACRDVRSPGPLLPPFTPEGGRWATGSTQHPRLGEWVNAVHTAGGLFRDTSQAAGGQARGGCRAAGRTSWLRPLACGVASSAPVSKVLLLTCTQVSTPRRFRFSAEGARLRSGRTHRRAVSGTEGSEQGTGHAGMLKEMVQGREAWPRSRRLGSSCHAGTWK